MPLKQVLPDSQNYFTPDRVAEERREILEKGFTADPFLLKNPDCPVFGINLACAYPFPPAVANAYKTLSTQLAGLDAGVYVYPRWETHVTLATFVNFNLFRRPSPEQLAEFKPWVRPIIDVMRNIFDKKAVKQFQLEMLPPILTRKAAILPINNPSGEIAQIRRGIHALLEGNKGMQAKLESSGLNIPGIIHSTVMRFRKTPRDVPAFLAGFDAMAAATPPFHIDVRKIVLTIETKPYMRDGEVAHRYSLADVKG